MYIDKDELLELLERKYGNLSDTGGCYVSTEQGYEWLSVANIVEIIKQCQIYKDCD